MKTIYSNDPYVEIGNDEDQKEVFLEEAKENGWDIPEDPTDLQQKAYEEAQFLTDTYFDDFKDNISNAKPANHKLTPNRERNNYNEPHVLVDGTYCAWNGHHHAYKEFKSIYEAILGVIPDYEATIQFFIDDDGKLAYKESSHDAPMGGTVFHFYFINERGENYMFNHNTDAEDLLGKKGLIRSVKEEDLGI